MLMQYSDEDTCGKESTCEQQPAWHHPHCRLDADEEYLPELNMGAYLSSKLDNNTKDDTMVNTINDNLINGETKTHLINTDLPNDQEMEDSHLIDKNHTEKEVINSVTMSKDSQNVILLQRYSLAPLEEFKLLNENNETLNLNDNNETEDINDNNETDDILKKTGSMKSNEFYILDVNSPQQEPIVPLRHDPEEFKHTVTTTRNMNDEHFIINRSEVSIKTSTSYRPTPVPRKSKMRQSELVSPKEALYSNTINNTSPISTAKHSNSTGETIGKCEQMTPVTDMPVTDTPVTNTPMTGTPVTGNCEEIVNDSIMTIAHVLEVTKKDNVKFQHQSNCTGPLKMCNVNNLNGAQIDDSVSYELGRNLVYLSKDDSTCTDMSSSMPNVEVKSMLPSFIVDDLQGKLEDITIEHLRENKNKLESQDETYQDVNNKDSVKENSVGLAIVYRTCKNDENIIQKQNTEEEQLQDSDIEAPAHGKCFENEYKMTVSNASCEDRSENVDSCRVYLRSNSIQLPSSGKVTIDKELYLIRKKSFEKDEFNCSDYNVEMPEPEINQQKELFHELNHTPGICYQYNSSENKLMEDNCVDIITTNNTKVHKEARQEIIGTESNTCVFGTPKSDGSLGIESDPLMTSDFQYLSNIGTVSNAAGSNLEDEISEPQLSLVTCQKDVFENFISESNNTFNTKETTNNTCKSDDNFTILPSNEHLNKIDNFSGLAVENELVAKQKEHTDIQKVTRYFEQLQYNSGTVIHSGKEMTSTDSQLLSKELGQEQRNYNNNITTSKDVISIPEFDTNSVPQVSPKSIQVQKAQRLMAAHEKQHIAHSISHDYSWDEQTSQGYGHTQEDTHTQKDRHTPHIYPDGHKLQDGHTPEIYHYGHPKKVYFDGHTSQIYPDEHAPQVLLDEYGKPMLNPNYAEHQQHLYQEHVTCNQGVDVAGQFHPNQYQPNFQSLPYPGVQFPIHQFPYEQFPDPQLPYVEDNNFNMCTNHYFNRYTGSHQWSDNMAHFCRPDILASQPTTKMDTRQTPVPSRGTTSNMSSKNNPAALVQNHGKHLPHFEQKYDNHIPDTSKVQPHANKIVSKVQNSSNQNKEGARQSDTGRKVEGTGMLFCHNSKNELSNVQKEKSSPRASQKLQNKARQATSPERKQQKQQLAKFDAGKDKSPFTEDKTECKYFLYVKGICPSTGETDIILYFETRTGSVFTGEKVIFNYTRTCALLDMAGKPNMQKLRENIKKKDLAGYKPDVYEVQAPSGIAVSCSKPILSTEALKYYFEAKRNGGGEIIGDVEESEDGSCYIIIFKDKQVGERVCKRPQPHTLDGVQLCVSPYYHCEAGDIWDTSLHTVHIPENVFIKLSLGKSLFLQKEFCQTWLANLHCSVIFDNCNLVISCLLTPVVPNFKHLVASWRDDVEHCADKFLSENITEKRVAVKDMVKFDHCDDKLEADIWTRLQSFLQSDLTHGLAGVVVIPEERSKEVQVVGFMECVHKLLAMMIKKVEDIARELRKTKEKYKIDRVKLCLLKKLEVFDKQKMDQNILMTIEDSEITLEGQPEEITEVRRALYETFEKMERHTETHKYSHEFVDFIQLKLRRLVDKLLADAGLEKVEWEINDTEVLICMFKDTRCVDSSCGKVNKSDVVQLITANLIQCSEHFKHEASDLFKSNEWITMTEDLTERYEHYAYFIVQHECCMVQIFGMKDQVLKIKESIKQFIDQNQIIKDKYRCEAIHGKYVKVYQADQLKALQDKFKEQKIKLVLEGDGVKISGKKDGIIAIKKELIKIFDSIQFCNHTINKVAVQTVYRDERAQGKIDLIEKNTRCLIMLPGELEELDMLVDARNDPYSSAEFDITSMDLEPLTAEQGTTSKRKYFRKKYFKAQNGLKILLVKGKISKQTADVLVVTTSLSLNLSSGKACKSILEDGGQSLQDECKTFSQADIPFGTLVCIHGGDLQCKMVYMTALPKWTSDGTSIKLLEKFMKESLEMASQYNVCSIAFIALGTGQLQYPTDTVAMTMYQSVIDFDKSNPKTTVKTVKFVIYHKDELTIEAFEEEEKLRVDGRGIRPQYKIQSGQIQIEVAVGNLAEQRVDGILCATSNNMDLHHGACRALLLAGGDSLTTECKTKYNNKLDVGNVVEIGKGNLLCKSIFLTVLPKYTADGTLDKLASAIKLCLNLAKAKGYRSISMPALGTGKLQYPCSEVCSIMFKTVMEWGEENRPSSLKTVRFIMYAKDYETIKKFKTFVMNAEKRGRRQGRVLKSVSGDLPLIDSRYNAVHNAFQIGNVNFKIVIGNILEESTDAIVSSVGKNFEFLGAVAQGLKKKCPTLEKHCQKYELSKFQRKGVATTDSMGLKAKYIIHVQYAKKIDSWKKHMLFCLQEADKNNCESLAFPVLGTGSGNQTFKAEDIAECLFDTIDEYARTAPKSGLKKVRLIVYKEQSEMFQPILDCLHKKVKYAVTTESSVTVLGKVKHFATNKSYKENKKDLQNLEVYIYSDSPNGINECIKELEATLEQAYDTKMITEYKNLIPKLNEQEVKQLENVQAVVDITTNKMDGIIQIKGPLKQVDLAHTDILAKLLGIERRMNDEKNAKELENTIQWFYEEVTDTGFELKKYDSYVNFKIEQAYKHDEKSLCLMSEDNCEYVLDFEKLVEYNKNDKDDIMRIMRKDALKSGSLALPKHWVVMTDKDNVKLFTLPVVDPVFESLQRRFVLEVNNGPYTNRIQFDKTKLQVTKIQRIQNITLYQLYEAKKKQITEQKPKLSQIELELWHGTTEDAVASIQTNGFNRSYCGKNGTWFGAGVYFAKDASYSSRGWLSGATANAPSLVKTLAPTTKPVKGYVFLAKVLTGQSCIGTPQMRYLPPVDQKTPLVLYDSAVDNLSSPMEYVIFNDTQAYPEYILTFTA